MVNMGLVVFSLALVLSIEVVTGRDATGMASPMDEEQAFYFGVEVGLDQMEKAGFFDPKDMKGELSRVEFHQAFEDAKAKENNEKSVFIAAFMNSLERMEKSGQLNRGVYQKLFPGGGKTLTPKLELALAKAYKEARQHEEHNGDAPLPQ